MRLLRYSYPNYRAFSPASNGLVRSSFPGFETELDRLFESALGSISSASSNRFPVDLYEDKNNTYVRAELPGVTREEIGVEVADGTLTVTATRKTPAVPATEKSEAQVEKSVSFTRSITLTEDVQTDNIAAAYENGVLTVTLPKREEAKPRKITVAVK